MKPFTPEQLARLQFKEPINFADLFDGPFLYSKQYPAPQGGSMHPYPPGYMFMSAHSTGPEQPTIKTFAGLGPWDYSLSAKPTEAVKAACGWRCMEGRINSLELVLWHEYGHALLIATDKTLIPSIHVARIPLATIPVITPDNTEKWHP